MTMAITIMILDITLTGTISITIISMRCAPTPPQCPLPSILIAVCVPMSSYCDFWRHVRRTSWSVRRGKLCHFFTKARCECLLPLPYGPPNPCQILQKFVPNRRGGYPRRALSVPKRPKDTQERPKRPPQTAKKRLESLLGALLKRFGRALGRFWEPNGTKMEPKFNQKLSKVVTGRVSHAHFVFFFSYDCLNFFKENVADFRNIVGKSKFVSWGGFD